MTAHPSELFCEQRPSSDSRRHFAAQCALALAGVTAGGICFPTVLAASTSVPSRAGFSWTVSDLDGTSALAYFRVLRNIVLKAFNIHAAYRISSEVAVFGSAKLSCKAGVLNSSSLRSGFGKFNPAPSNDFDAAMLYNPNNLTIDCDSSPIQDAFYSAILASSVPPSGKSSHASRQVRSTANIAVTAGAYLCFYLVHAGVPGDGHLGVVLEFDS
ncbi:MAG: hypothetical protein WA867_16300 [Candidatus Acidiferrales bacterium]